MTSARKIRDLTSFQGKAALYELSEPTTFVDLGVTRETYFVVVSAIVFPPYRQTEETMIFPANAEGEIVSWLELHGVRGSLSHAQAIYEAGWKLEENFQ